MADGARLVFLAGCILAHVLTPVAERSCEVGSSCEADHNSTDASAMLQVVSRGHGRKVAVADASNPVIDGGIDDWNQVADMVNDYYAQYGNAVEAGYDTTMAVMSAIDDLQRGDSWQNTVIAVAKDLLPVVDLVCPVLGTVAGLFLSLFKSPDDMENELEKLRKEIITEVAHMIDDRIAMDNYQSALAAVASMTDVINDHPKWVGKKTVGYNGDWEKDAGTTFKSWGDLAIQNLRWVFSTDCLSLPDAHSPVKKKSDSCLKFQRYGPLLYQAQFATLHINLIAQWGAFILTDQPTCKKDMITWSARYAALLEDSLSGFLSVVAVSEEHASEHLIPPCRYAYPKGWGHPKCPDISFTGFNTYNCHVDMDAANVKDPVTQRVIADVMKCTNSYTGNVHGNYCKCKGGTTSTGSDRAADKDRVKTHFGGNLCEVRDGELADSKDGRPLCTNQHYTAYREQWMGEVERLHWPLIVRMKGCGSGSILCHVQSIQHTGTRLFISNPTDIGTKHASGTISFNTSNVSVIGLSVVTGGDCGGACKTDAGVVYGFGLLGASSEDLRKYADGKATSVSMPEQGVFGKTGTTIGVCPDGLVIIGLTAHWRGTCQGKCNKDGPVLGSMNVKCGPIPPSAGLETFALEIPAKAQGTTTGDCPPLFVLSKLLINTEGLCQNSCSAPMIESITMVCSRPLV